jgi:hypothetical protein
MSPLEVMQLTMDKFDLFTVQAQRIADVVNKHD